MYLQKLLAPGSVLHVTLPISLLPTHQMGPFENIILNEAPNYLQPTIVVPPLKRAILERPQFSWQGLEKIFSNLGVS